MGDERRPRRDPRWALESQGYYLDPTLADEFSADQLAALTAGLEAAAQPTYVIVFPLRDNDVYGGSGVDLITRLLLRLPRAGCLPVDHEAGWR